MAPLLSAENICKAHGHRVLFDKCTLQIFSGDKIGLVGPNGMGKSSLLKILSGEEPADSGEVICRRDLKVAYVPQMKQYPDSNLEDYVISTLSKDEHLDQHECEVQARIMLGKVGFEDSQVEIKTLSGGWKKRLDLANALAINPDLILLDEPTNHLDLEGILWLEKFLGRCNVPYIITSHDRAFLEEVTNRMMEINSCYPTGVFTVDGRFSTFLEKRETFLKGQQQQQQSLASKVRREIEWLRQTPQARTTKSRSRIKEAHRLKGELSQVKGRNASTKVQIEFSKTEKGSKKLLKANNLSKTLGGKELFSKIDILLSPGMCLAIAGGNGTGKTTMMKILAGAIESDSGNIKYADDLQIVYFDQQRESLPDDISVKEALAPNGETVHYRGKPYHVNSWGKRFLFTPDRLELPVGRLSGGEKARILIARLMTKPADILFLDEPTNDLDIQTLEMLEDSLAEFPGAIVLITHDRFVLNNLATDVLGLGCEGKDYLFADFAQWTEYYESHKKQVKKQSKEVEKKVEAPSRKKKLSYKEKFELENIEGKISEAEDKIAQLDQALEDPSLASDSVKLQETCDQLSQTQNELEKLYARWEELEG